MRKTFTLILICVSVLATATVRNVPASYPTVQGALNSCLPGDTVLVQPGTYFENITWPAINPIKLLSAGDSSNTIIDGNNLGSVITFSSAAIDTNTVIRGFTITHGYKTGSAANGGGMLISNASPKFEDVAVKDNGLNAGNWAYGAGVHCSNSSVVFENSTIRNNHTDSASWGYGGGAYLSGSGSPQFRNVKIENNSVRSDSWNHGTGIYCADVYPVFENTIVRNNIAGDSAIWCYGTGMYFDGGLPTLTNVMITGNISGKGCTYYYGTGIYLQDCHANLTNVLIAGNILSDGGNFYYGGGIYQKSMTIIGSLVLMNVTVTDNKRSNGGSINGSGLYIDALPSIGITNSIFWNVNPGAEISANGATVVATYSDIRGGLVGIGNINSTPGFISPTDFHLSAASPCVNTGTLTGAPSFDLDNMPRPAPVGTNPDMGCYETSQPVSVIELQHSNLLFDIFPNPAKEYIVVSSEFGVNVKTEITITDAIGKLCLRTPNSILPTKIDIRNFPNGIYFVSVDDGNQKAVKKFIKT
ncbi:MAG: T9SS type A sorting domain-containing protein [Bacteroidia bacterium]